MVPLPSIHYGRLYDWFFYNYAALVVVLEDAGAIVLVIEYVLVLGLLDETEVSYLETPAIVLTEDAESLCWMLINRELIAKHPCAFLQLYLCEWAINMAAK